MPREFYCSATVPNEAKTSSGGTAGETRAKKMARAERALCRRQLANGCLMAVLTLPARAWSMVVS